MKIRRRTNLLLGIIPLAVAILLLLRELDTFPDGLDDLIWRAWPLLLVLIGLVLLLRDRVRLGGLIGVVVSAVLIGGVVTMAYSLREGEQSDDQQLDIAEEIDDLTALLVVNIRTLDTVVDVRASSDERQISGEFIGSLSSEVNFDCVDTDARITECTFTEEKPDQFPLLDEVGRGTLALRLPSDVPVAIAYDGENGSTTFDMSGTLLERISLDVAAGDVLITLPEYEPQSPSAVEEPGQITVNNGDLTVVVPSSVNARLVFDRRGNSTDPEFDPLYIEQRDGVDGVLRRDDEDGEFTLTYEIVIPRGLLRLDVSESAASNS